MFSINEATNYEIEPDELVTKADRLDCRFWEIIHDETPAARESFPDRASTVVGADMFNSLYQYTPEISEKAKDDHRAAWIRKIIDTSTFTELHTATQGDETLAAVGAINLRQQFEQDETTRELQKKIEQLTKVNEQIKESQDKSWNSGNAIDSEYGSMLNKRDALEQEVDQMLDDKNTMRAIRRQMQSTTEDLKNAQQIASGWSNENATISQILFDPANKIKADNVRNIMKLAGRMRQVISAQRAKRPTAAPQRVSIELGDDLSRLVPTELGVLADPNLENLFYKRYMERGLTLVKRDENPRLGKGAFIICIDESGSMSGAKNEWSKAIAYALCQQAHIEKRPFGAIAFSNQHSQREIFHPELPDMLTWLGMFFGGGTNFEQPLTDAMKMIKASMPDADIIFITDGECDITDQFAAQFKLDKEANKVKVIGINVGNDENCLKKFSDSIFTLHVKDGIKGLESVIDEMK